MKIYKHNPDHSFLGYDIKCYESTAYNVIACLTLISWLIYFSVGTFVVSKLQFLNRTSPFIVYEGFATMLQLFKFFSVLLIVTSYDFQLNSSFTIAKLSILSVLLVAMTVYSLLKKFAFHPFARAIHTAGIVLLLMVNLSIVIWIGARKQDFT